MNEMALFQSAQQNVSLLNVLCMHTTQQPELEAAASYCRKSATTGNKLHSLIRRPGCSPGSILYVATELCPCVYASTTHALQHILKGTWASLSQVVMLIDHSGKAA